VSDVMIEVRTEGLHYGYTDFLDIHVGTLVLRVTEVVRFGQRVDVTKITPSRKGEVLPSKRWGGVGFYKKGRCTKIDEEVSAADTIQLVRDLAVRLNLAAHPAADAWVAVGNDKLFVSDAKQSWSVIRNDQGIQMWSSTVGGRARWPEATIPVTSYGRPIVPLTWIMDLVRKHVDRLVDPYAWKDSDTMRLGGRER